MFVAQVINKKVTATLGGSPLDIIEDICLLMDDVRKSLHAVLPAKAANNLIKAACEAIIESINEETDEPDTTPNVTVHRQIVDTSDISKLFEDIAKRNIGGE